MAEETLNAPPPRFDPGALKARLSTPGPVLYGVIAGTVGLLAVIVALVLWAGEPDYQPLYRGLPENEAGQIMEALAKANVPHRVDRASGALLVPADKVHETRLKLAAQGLPRGATNGFELLDQHNGFGVSQFMENARYQRALEGELARSVMSIGAVANARVHLAIPKESVFVRNRQPPSASVLVQLAPGRVLDGGQVAAIVHLVSSSVPRLPAEQVSVVDQAGNLLTRPAGSALGMNMDQMDYRQRMEADTVRRVEDLLTPLLGVGRLRAQAALDLDFDNREETTESFDPRREPGMVRSEQLMEEVNGRPEPVGIPGALSNQPPGVASAPEQAPGAPAQAGQPPAAPGQAAQTAQPGGQPGQLAQTEAQKVAEGSRGVRSRREHTRNFELDKRVAHVRATPGSVRRLSVAVLLDDKLVDGARTPFSQEELDRITALVKEAVGFDARRGDTVNVMNASFANNTVLPDLGPFWQQPWFIELVKWGIGGLVALAFLLWVARPAVKRLLPEPPAPAPALSGGERLPALPDAAEQGVGELAEDRLMLAGYGVGAVPQLPSDAAAKLDERLETARRLVAEDPKRAVQVIRAWLDAPDPLLLPETENAEV